ncbi:MAG TPA: DUF3084 domain-containing protein [Oscillatoriales cyanobacterium M59_W2019_021]|nr:DUF3084 domain-containing protein [Oscillatoriales cyanobacterium M4454_W2019_049]HIK51227.1 DUF3084 domain-containing protein [Oscillatoriales cyanobacterium M59_W2019_021]
MTTGYILILAVLILGGAIATVGDRIGTKVGKARLSLFKMRPRQTATVVTILSGSVVAATTLGILLAADKQLRTGIFELDEIQQDLRKARREIRETGDRKQQVERELTAAQAEQAQAKRQLKEIEQSLEEVSVQLEEALEKQAATDEQLVQAREDLAQTQEELTQVDRERDRASQERQIVASQLDRTLDQKDALESEIQALQTERQQLVEQREAVIAQITERDREIQQNQQFIASQQQQIETQRQQVALQQERIKSQQQQVDRQQQEIKSQQQQLSEQEKSLSAQEQALEEREALLKELEARQAELSQQVAVLEEGFRLLRERRVAIGRGQVLASGVIRAVQPFGARQAIDRLLQESDRVASGLIRPGVDSDRQIVRIPIADVDEVVRQIQDGNEYVVRVLSAGNYILGEEAIGVYLEFDRNRLVYEAGEIVSATSIDPTTMTQDEVLDSMEFLIEAARLRALQAGILAERIQVADSRESVIEFIKQLQEQQEPLEVQAISTDLTYTAGPLKLQLVAVRNGEIIFESR